MNLSHGKARFAVLFGCLACCGMAVAGLRDYIPFPPLPVVRLQAAESGLELLRIAVLTPAAAVKDPTDYHADPSTGTLHIGGGILDTVVGSIATEAMHETIRRGVTEERKALDIDLAGAAAASLRQALAEAGFAAEPTRIPRRPVSGFAAVPPTPVPGMDASLDTAVLVVTNRGWNDQPLEIIVRARLLGPDGAVLFAHNYRWGGRVSLFADDEIWLPQQPERVLGNSITADVFREHVSAGLRVVMARLAADLRPAGK